MFVGRYLKAANIAAMTVYYLDDAKLVVHRALRVMVKTTVDLRRFRMVNNRLNASST